MEFNSLYAILAILVLGINTIPAFMPPTWSVLAFFYLHFNLAFIPTIIIGATFATSGRLILYLLAKHFSKHLPDRFKENYHTIGKYFDKRQHLTIPVVLLYAFLPIPSNQIFIIAGLSKAKIGIIAFSFFVGRLISYTFWVNVADRAADRLENIFSHHFANTSVLILELIGIILIILIGQIKWKRLLKI